MISGLLGTLQYLVPSHPSVQARYGYSRFVNRCRTFEVEQKDPDINALARDYVPPHSIERFTGRVGSDDVHQVRQDIGSVRSGEWDDQSGRNLSPHLPKCLTDVLYAERVDETHLFQSLDSHFNDGTEWALTPYFEAFVETVERGIEWHGCKSREDVLNRFEVIDRLYESIRCEGYSPQNEIETHSSILVELANEIGVDVSRDGELLLVCGRHRLAIAQLLGLEEVPVVPVVYHSEYFK